MELIVLISLLLALFGSLGHCGPSSKKRNNIDGDGSIKKRVSFGETEKVFVLPSDPDDIFWLNKKEFAAKISEMSEFYGESSIQGRFIHLLADAVDKNSKMFKRIWWYANMFESYKVILSQIIVLNNDWKLRKFPPTKHINKVENDKKDFKEKLIELLTLLMPSYGIVEHLYNLLDQMPANTRIHPNRLGPLNEQAEKINEIFQEFESIFEHFPLPIYRENVDYVRKTTNRLAGLVITREVASMRLSLGLDNLKELRPKIEQTLREAKTIDFAKLHAATKTFYDCAAKALNV